MDQFIPLAFPALALAHFVALVSPGQDFVIITSYALRYRLKGSLFICLGIALGNGVYILVAFMGWQIIREASFIYLSIQITGAAYLLWIGGQMVRSTPQSPPKNSPGNKIVPKKGVQLTIGMQSALLNPKNAIFYLSLLSSLLSVNVSTTQQVFCGLWMVGAVFVWDLFVAALISHPVSQKYLRRYIPIIGKTCGYILLAISASLILHLILWGPGAF